MPGSLIKAIWAAKSAISAQSAAAPLFSTKLHESLQRSSKTTKNKVTSKALEKSKTQKWIIQSSRWIQYYNWLAVHVP